MNGRPTTLRSRLFHVLREALLLPTFFVVFVCALAPGIAAAETVRIEAETFVSSYDAGHVAARTLVDSHASNNMSVVNFDWQGMWLEFDLELAGGAQFYPAITSAGSAGLVRTFLVTFTPAGASTPAASVTFITPPGLGAG